MPVGLSDHSMGSLADVVAVSLGAQVIEKHVCLDRTIDNPDAAFSMEIGEFAQMVQDVRNACVIKGKATYELTEHEKSSLKYRRSLVAVKPIAEGEAFTGAMCIRDRHLRLKRCFVRIRRDRRQYGLALRHIYMCIRDSHKALKETREHCNPHLSNLGEGHIPGTLRNHVPEEIAEGYMHREHRRD